MEVSGSNNKEHYPSTDTLLQQVNRLAISPDKRFLAAAGNGTVKLYDIATSAAGTGGANVGPVRLLPYHQRSSWQKLTFNVSQLVTLTGHTANVTSLAWHAEAKWLVSGSEDGTVKIWDVRYEWLASPTK